jgi:hypothetical protein
MAGVDFLINFKQKGLEVVDKTKKSMNDLLKAEQNLTKQAKENTKENDKLAKSYDEINKEQESTIRSTNKVSVAFKQMKDNAKSAIDNNEKLKDSMKNIGVGLGAAIATASAALVAYSKIVIDLTVEQQRLADQSNINFERFQALSQAASLFGVEAGTLSEKLADMNIAITEAARGEGELVEFLKELNINAVELAKLSPEDQFYRLSEAIKSIPENEALLVLDKAKIKDIKLLADNYDSLKNSVEGFIATGLIPKNAEEFSEFNTNIKETKINIQNFAATVLNELLPVVNELYSKFNESLSEDFLNLENADTTIKTLKGIINLVLILSNSISVVKNAIELVFEVLIAFAVSVKDVLIAPINVFIEFLKSVFQVNFINVFETIGNKVLKLGNYFLELQAKAELAYSSILETLGADEKASEVRIKALEKLAKVAEKSKELDVELDINFETSNIEQEFDKVFSNKFEVFKSRFKKQTDDLSEDIADIFKNVDELSNPDRLDTYGTKPVKNKSDEIKDITIDTLSEINNLAKNAQTELLDALIPSLEDYQNQLNNLRTKFELGDISESTFKDEGVDILENILNLTKGTNKELEARLQAKKFIEEFDKKEEESSKKKKEQEKERVDIFEKVKILQDEYRAGLKTEEISLAQQAAEYDKIAKTSKDQQVVLQALVGLRETENKLLDIQLQKQKEIKRQEDELLNKRVEVLRAQGRELEALQLEEESRIERVKEQFTDLEMQAEAVELEKALINTEKTKAQLDEVKQQIDDLNAELNSNNFFTDADRNVQIQEDLIRLKKQQIELEGKHADAIDKTSSLSLFTYEKVAEITSDSFDVLAEASANIIAQTDSTSKIVRKAMADILTEINKVLLRQLALNIANQLGGGTMGGGFAGAFTNLISTVARNHTGTNAITADHTSGQYGLQPDEVLRVLNTNEIVINRTEAKNLKNKSTPSSVNANVNIQASRVAPAIIREGYSDLDEWAKARGLFK